MIFISKCTDCGAEFGCKTTEFEKRCDECNEECEAKSDKWIYSHGFCDVDLQYHPYKIF